MKMLMAGMCLALISVQVNAQYYISTVAGDGTAGFSGDGGTASSAQLDNPGGVAIDADGNLYVADADNDRVRKVEISTGNISTVAGNGVGGYSGDGGPATSAQLNGPNRIAIDASGNIYISDTYNYRVRKVDVTTGNISTVAGNGTRGFSGDGGLAINAQFSRSYGYGLAVDTHENIYITDFDNNRLRKVDATTGLISTIAGIGTAGDSGDGGPATNAQLWRPSDVALDTNGNIYIADYNNELIRKIDINTGIIFTVAGGGNSGDGSYATDAWLGLPRGITIDANGNLYIADGWHHSIRKVDNTTGYISTIAGNKTSGDSGDGGPATSAQLHDPHGLEIDANGDVYIADYENHRIRKLTTTLANPDPSQFSFQSIGGEGGEGGKKVTADAAGNVYLLAEATSTSLVIGEGDNAVTLSNPSGALSMVFAKYHSDGTLAWAKNITNGNVVATDMKLDTQGNVFLVGYYKSEGSNFDPDALAADAVLTAKSAFIAKYSTADGQYQWVLGTDNTEVHALAIDNSDNLYVTGQRAGNAFVSKYNTATAANGQHQLLWDFAIDADSTGKGIALDADNNVYITGRLSTETDFDPGAGVANLNPYDGHVFIAKYNTDGAYLNGRMTATSSNGGHLYNMKVSDIAVDSNNHAYLFGYYNGTLNFGDGFKGTGGVPRIFLAKYDESLGSLWMANPGSYTGQDDGYELVIDNQNNTYVTGYFSLTADFNPNGISVEKTSEGHFDIFVASYDTHGLLREVYNFGSPGDERGSGIHVDASGTLYFAGHFNGDVDFSHSSNPAEVLSSQGGSDIYLVKYPPILD
jgi:sugar lactone lactonase YvrE